MSKNELQFDNYLSDINPEFETYVMQVYEKLTAHGCAVKLQEAKSGYVVSFLDPETKKTVANFISRKKGPIIRIYGDNAGKYMDVIASLPDNMLKDIEKAPVCRRLIDPAKCNSRCVMGNILTINGVEHKKCRINCFMFVMDAQNIPSILALLDSEISQRTAG
jgi:hypothetical protein